MCFVNASPGYALIWGKGFAGPPKHQFMQHCQQNSWTSLFYLRYHSGFFLGQFVFCLPVDAGKHSGDPHVSDLWCVICCATGTTGSTNGLSIHETFVFLFRNFSLWQTPQSWLFFTVFVCLSLVNPLTASRHCTNLVSQEDAPQQPSKVTQKRNPSLLGCHQFLVPSQFVSLQPLGAGIHDGDPHVFDLWCVTCCATGPSGFQFVCLLRAIARCTAYMVISGTTKVDITCRFAQLMILSLHVNLFQGYWMKAVVFFNLLLFQLHLFWVMMHSRGVMQLISERSLSFHDPPNQEPYDCIAMVVANFIIRIIDLWHISQCLQFSAIGRDIDFVRFFPTLSWQTATPAYQKSEAIQVSQLTKWTRLSSKGWQPSFLPSQTKLFQPMGLGKHSGDPHVSDLWCVIHCATEPIGNQFGFFPIDSARCTAFEANQCTTMACLTWHFTQWRFPFLHLNLFQALRGIRIGEAMNPGPSTRRTAPTCLNFAVINPTALFNKVGTFVSLRNKFNIHVFALSETSATESAQVTLSRQFATHRLTVNWSPPVPPQRDTLKCDRGKASGTAILASVPMRPCRHQLPDPWITSTRLNRAIIQIGQSHLQIWTVYGFSPSQPRSKERTNDILTFVHSQLDLVPLPFIICGDFNAEVTELPIWSTLAQRGACDLAQIHQSRYGVPMPKTCHHATRPDSAIVSKDLVSLVCSIKVLPSTWFSAHAPVLFTIKLPDVALFRRHFTLPRSFMEFAPSSQDLAEAHNHIAEHHPPPSTLEEWGQTVEATVDQWLSQKGASLGIPQGLPKAFRGRCTDLRLQKKPVVSQSRLARQGDYEPPDEILSLSTKRKVTQHRRIESLLRRLKAVPEPQSKDPRYFSDLCQEWICILKSNCYGPRFASWLSHIPELGLPPWPLPSEAYLFDVLQYSRYHLEQSIARDRKTYHDKAIFASKLDRQHMGSKQAFSRIRGTPRSPVTTLHKQMTCQATSTWNPEHKTVELCHPDLANFQSSSPFCVEGIQGKLCRFEAGHVTLQMDTVPDPVPNTVMVTQCTELCDPEEVTEQLTTYWTKWWFRQEQLISDDAPWEFDDLLQHLPSLPPIDIDFTLPALKHAISKIKQNSARGFDGISAFELQTLPDSLLAQLLVVFNNYSTGFPSWFMRARTFPLRKCDGTPQAHQTRPITVLSQLYRVWGSLICGQILLQWQYTLPKGITGMLPTRGSHLAAYAAQLGIEADHFFGRDSTGLTLDLRKCFNLISHQAGRRLLLATGIPSELVEQWISSIRSITRYWEVESSHFGPVISNNGFPEGDIWSVVVMIAIGLHWITTIEDTITEEIACTAYADNWGWKTNSPAANVDAVHATCSFLSPYGLQIDWDKTWCWGTSASLAHQVQMLLQESLPDVPIAILSHSRDLGFELQYSGPHRVGHRRSRFDEGFSRLSRLEQLNVDLRVKEHILLSSVWPASLYGSEIFPPAGELLNRLASKAADALVGRSRAMTPSLVLLLLGSQILDPTFVCIHMALRAARSWLRLCTPTDCLRFYHLVATSIGRSQDIKGPAATLRYYLNIVDWQCNKQGYLQVAPFIQVHLLNDSWQRIESFLSQAWQQDLIVTRTHRSGLFNLPDISRQDMVGILKKFSDPARRKLVREIAGAFQTTNQKKHWVPDHSDQCAFCPDRDSKYHRLCACPAFADIREPFLPILHELQDRGHSMLEFPVIHVHPDFLVHQHLQYKEPRAIFSEPICKHMRQRCSVSDDPIQFYTDGSCFHPENPTTRYASYAIIMDTCSSDQERLIQIAQFEVTGRMPSTLVLAAAARVHGEQTINRAELMAVSEIVKQIPQAVIFSDSAYTCSAVEECFNSTTQVELDKCANLDLHIELLQSLNPRHRVCKIAAHQDISKIRDGISKYRALGNKMANDFAISTCADYNKQWQLQLEKRHVEVQTDRDLLHSLLTLHLQLGDARAAGERQLDPAESSHVGTHFGAQDIKQILISWHPQVPIYYDNTDLRDELCEYFSWGPQWAEYFSAWLQHLGWESNAVTPLQEEVGVTWLELALSYMLFSKHWIPCLRSDNDNITRIVFPKDDDHADSLGYQATDAAVNFAAMWTQYHSLLLDSGPVSLVRGLQKSLAVMGAKCRCSGFTPRPFFPFHADVVKLAAELMNDRTSYKFTFTMPCPLRLPSHLPSLVWHQRKSHLKFGQSRSRCLKKTLGE